MSSFRSISLLSLASIAGLLLASCGQSQPATTTTPDSDPVAVLTATVTAGAVTPRQELPGTIRARQRATVAAKVLGTVQEAGFAIGKPVELGEVLVVLSADELTARVAQARAALDLAAREFEREAALLSQGATAQEVVNRLEDNRRIAAANVAQAEAQLDYTRITAPFSGVITARHVEPGDLATPGTPLFEVEGQAAFEVAVAVPDSLPQVALGETLQVSTMKKTLAARVREASPAADPRSRTRLVVLELPIGEDVRSGQYVRVLWPVAQREQLTVPSSTVTPFGQMQRVFVAEGGEARLRLVRTGAIHGERTVVLSGLNAGETVVIDPPTGLRDGQPVTAALQP